MDQSSAYGVSDLAGFQVCSVSWQYVPYSNAIKFGSRGDDIDTSMSEGLEGGMSSDFNSLPMTIDANSLIDGVEKLYTPPNSGMSNRTFTTGTTSMPSSGDGLGSRPAGFGAPSTGSVTSTLTEPSKKRNFPQRIVEDLKDLLHILTPDGRIVYLSPGGRTLTGYPPEELLGKFILDFIHPDDSAIFVQDFNESIRSGGPLQLFYRFRKRDGTYTIFESRGHPHLTPGAAAFGANNSVGVCEQYFMMARPYPTHNTALHDSFLEHKVENLRLTRRINDLKREEAEEAEEEQRQRQGKQGRHSDVSFEDINSIGQPSTASPRLMNPSAMMVMPPTHPFSMDDGNSRRNEEDASTNRQSDSINGQATRYDSVTHIETIELLTGLQYQDGERSHGISTGDQSPTLVRGDAGIAIPVNKESKGADKKKKIKLPEEYVCTDCGMSHYLRLKG